MKTRYLSKTKILSGIQCPKRLYFEIRKPELLNDAPRPEFLFYIGNKVGEMACRLIPDGKFIDYSNGLTEAISVTHKLLKEQPDTPIFEATFSYGGILIRADIFYKGEKGYRLVEVKAATSVKDYYLTDCAVQAWVIESSGYPLEKVELAHVDNSFIYQGDGDYNGLLNHEDITDAIAPLKDKVPNWADDFQSMLKEDVPDIDIGPHCNNPYDCPFVGHCSPEPPKYPVSTLYRGGKLIEELLNEGIDDIREIPDGRLRKPIHKKMRRVVLSEKPEIDSRISSHLKEFPYPRYYLDFETLGSGVPIWAGTRPYQQHLPFQWSCHIEQQDGSIEHSEYLDLACENPMRPLAEKLIDTLAADGPIFVYSGYENSVIKNLGQFFADLQEALDQIRDRLIDLLPLVRENYYHHELMGSFSIKYVLPTVAPELNYSELEIQDGMAAGMAYLQALEPETDDTRGAELESQMLKYCGLDSLAMVKVVKYFERVIPTKDL